MPTPKQLLATLTERGTCSAEDLATALKCSVGKVLSMVNSPESHGGVWWKVEKLAWNGPGFLYTKRIFHEARTPFVARREWEE